MKSVRDVLRGGDGVLRNLATDSAHREALNALLDGFLDAPFRHHVQVASITDGTLILCADNPTWGHRVRYLAPSILEHFAGLGVPGLRQVSISVRQQQRDPKPSTPAPGPVLSAASASVLEGAAANLDNPTLARRLRAIARHGSGDG